MFQFHKLSWNEPFSSIFQISAHHTRKPFPASMIFADCTSSKQNIPSNTNTHLINCTNHANQKSPCLKKSHWNELCIVHLSFTRILVGCPVHFHIFHRNLIQNKKRPWWSISIILRSTHWFPEQLAWMSMKLARKILVQRKRSTSRERKLCLEARTSDSCRNFRRSIHSTTCRKMFFDIKTDHLLCGCCEKRPALSEKLQQRIRETERNHKKWARVRHNVTQNRTKTRPPGSPRTCWARWKSQTRKWKCVILGGLGCSSTMVPNIWIPPSAGQPATIMEDACDRGNRPPKARTTDQTHEKRGLHTLEEKHLVNSTIFYPTTCMKSRKKRWMRLLVLTKKIGSNHFLQFLVDFIGDNRESQFISCWNISSALWTPNTLFMLRFYRVEQQNCFSWWRSSGFEKTHRIHDNSLIPIIKKGILSIALWELFRTTWCVTNY